MIKAKKILFITQEMVPYVPNSTLSRFGRETAEGTQGKSREIRTFMPKWGIINERRNQLHEVIRLSGMNLIIDDTDHPLIIKVASISSARMQVYFIDNDDYFNKRRMGRDENNVEYEDNAERAIFYARGVLETVKKLRWVPEVIHCQGWMSSIIPMYIKTYYAEEPAFRDCKLVYTPSGDTLCAPLPDNFQDIIQLKKARIDYTEGLPDVTTAQALNYLGIKYSEGIALLRPNASYEEFAASLNKPILPTQDPKDIANAYPGFYDAIWGEGKTEEQEED